MVGRSLGLNWGRCWILTNMLLVVQVRPNLCLCHRGDCWGLIPLGLLLKSWRVRCSQGMWFSHNLLPPRRRIKIWFRGTRTKYLIIEIHEWIQLLRLSPNPSLFNTNDRQSRFYVLVGILNIQFTGSYSILCLYFSFPFLLIRSKKKKKTKV